MSEEMERGTAVLSASCPGGIARQFRVQISSHETPSRWKLAGSFRDAGQARACADELRRHGSETRIVCCRSLATAG